MITWTIKIDEQLDKLSSKLLAELGYTSKAELIRELLREKILELNLIKYEINTIDRNINSKMELGEALSELKKLNLPNEKIEKIVTKSRNELEGILFNDTKPDS